MQARIELEEDGVSESLPRIYFVRDVLEERDLELEARKMPASTEEEMIGYVWDTGVGRKKGEQPVDKDNHGLDCVRYACAYADSTGRGAKRKWGVV